jgi:hypothetical protein|tara:strand:- start:688 stop:1092 length:405 start_codon:yes stop_codon:yes gene_type:complete
MKTKLNFIFLSFLFVLNSCCFGAKEEYLGNNIYLSEYDNVDRRILYQKESCATTGTEIVPMTILEISYNSEWVIAKSGSKRKNSDFKYWVIKNNYENLPNSETVIENRIEFSNLKKFESYLVEKNIELKLRKID